jgi:leucyl aminopeptidase
MKIKEEKMDLNKTIKIAKKLIDLPYNKFNLENYIPQIIKFLSDDEFGFHISDINQPIKLMSGNHKNSGIVTYNQLISPYRKRNIYIVGKGILFDSGGMDLKPSGKMTDMTDDKAGAIIALTIANYLKGNVVAYCPITTNFIHTSKITPGDEIKIGKKIVKITNTDAEGRLILAEALTTLHLNKDDIVITIATLTGAVGCAIGELATGVFSTNQALGIKYLNAAAKSGEYAWRLPTWDYLQKKYYNKKVIQNSFKEIKEGATEGALFIKQFVPYPENWIHLDIAYSAFGKNKKATGVPIKSIIKFIGGLK